MDAQSEPDLDTQPVPEPSLIQREGRTPGLPVRRILLVMPTDAGFFARAVAGAIDYARQQQDWVVRIVNPSWGHTVGRAICEWRPQGLVLSHVFKEAADHVNASGLPAVGLGNGPDCVASQVAVDEYAAGALAADDLLGRGLTRLAFVGNPVARFAVGRREGFIETVERAHAVRPEVTLCGETGVGARGRFERARSLRKWLRRLPRPVGIFCVTDNLAFDLAEACRENRLRVPLDVAILGMDDNPLVCRAAIPPLSSVINPAMPIGRLAAETLHRLLRGEAVPAHQAIPPPGVVTRRSTDVLACDDPTVRAAVRHLRENLHRSIEIDELADVAASSRRSLELHFRRYLGRSPSEYVRKARLDRAAELLRETDWPVSHVATRCGWRNETHLWTLFRQAFGVTPAAYRKSNRPDGVG